MFPLVLASSTGFLWHSIPLILAISLVYGATRHEWIVPILHNAYRTAVWILGFVAIVVVVLVAVNWFV